MVYNRNHLCSFLLVILLLCYFSSCCCKTMFTLLYMAIRSARLCAPVSVLQFYVCRMKIIDRCFSRRTIEEIISSLVSLRDEWLFDAFFCSVVQLLYKMLINKLSEYLM